MANTDPTNLACKTCGLPLINFPGPAGEVEIVHSRPWEDHDHEPVPAPSATVSNLVRICDFCGDPKARWRYHGRSMQEYLGLNTKDEGVWAACDTCDRLVLRKDFAGLAQHYIESETPAKSFEYMFGQEPLADRANRSELIKANQQQIWREYVGSIFRRELIPVIKPLAPMRPAQMPKIRDRLCEFWRDPEVGGSGVHAELRESGAGFIRLPGMVVDHPEHFVVKTPHVTDEMVARFTEHMALGLEASSLYWISPRFTHQAVRAGKKLPDLIFNRDELPASHGFMIWEEPVFEIKHLVNGRDIAASIVAVSWTLVPNGLWLVAYCQPEAYMTIAEPAIVRQKLGWLIPASTGSAARFGSHENSSDLVVLATTVATWLLMKQEKFAERTEEKILADTKRSYKKAGRPEPKVHVVNIRRTERAHRSSEEPTTRNYTGSWTVGFETGGFWRDYWTGPGRAVRDRRWISPYVARQDLPVKPGKVGTAPTVKVLR